MTPERWQRVKALFSATLEVAPQERPAFLALESQGDEALIDEVATLLASHDAPGEFLEAVPPNLRTQAFAAADSHVGERIGAYRIVGMLGTGGMGDVLRGVRDDDQYRAEVAIKLMRADLRDSFAEQRFKTERQILARLDHRNIARLLDGGTTQAGLPYVVMELVHGEPIDRYCDAHSSTGTRTRAALPAGVRRRELRAPAPGRAPRPQAQQHPGDHRRLGQTTGLRHRQAAGGQFHHRRRSATRRARNCAP